MSVVLSQAAQGVEDTKTEPIREPLLDRPAQGENALARIRLDTVIGMGISNIVALAIMATAAATLHVSNNKEIESAAQAAEALHPLAGSFAFSNALKVSPIRALVWSAVLNAICGGADHGDPDANGNEPGSQWESGNG
jgi:Mn2+/Fe2+ NRAMP family transporter